MFCNKILNHYANLYNESKSEFTLTWIGLALFPLICSFIFDKIAINAQNSSYHHLLIITLNIIPVIVAIVVIVFLTISIWAAFSNKINIKQKFLMIICAYLLIWFSYGNLYYFACDVDNYDSIQTIKQESLNWQDFRQKAQDLQNQTPLREVNPFWDINSDYALQPINRFKNFIDCFYYSGITMLTIGFGDITPVSPLLKLLSLLQGFLGQIIVVVALGIWLSDSSK